MSRNKGRRYNGEQKLNMKKVFAVIVAIIVIVMFVFGIKTLLSGTKGEDVTNINYFTAFSNQKYGVINSAGETIIDPSYAEYIVIPNSKKDIFICTYDVNYETGEYKTKALNAKNEEIFTDYEQIEPISHLDQNNNLTYENNAIKVMKNGKYGMIDIQGKEILPCEYDTIESLRGVNNSLVIIKDGKMGIANSKGEVVATPTYQDIKAIGNDYQLGYIVANEQNQYGTIDCNNIKVLNNQYEEIKPFTENNLYVVKEAGKYKLINTNGSTSLEIQADDIKNMKRGNIIIRRGEKYGVINSNGEEILPIKYDDITFAFEDMFIVESNGKYGLVKPQDQIVYEIKYETMNYIEKADFVEASEDGINSDIIGNDLNVKLTGIISEINTEKEYIRLRNQEDYKYYNFKFEEKKSSDILTTNTLFLSKNNGKYGFVDKNGNVVVDYIYDDATEQNAYGFAAIKKDGKWGSINKEGKVIVEPTYNLDNNIAIDFIGTWYFGEDINMNYYKK